jgi:putative flippase GtrA
MIKQFFSKQFFLFLFTGGTSAAINYASRFFYNLWTDFSTSIILAYITGMAVSFMLSRLFVFKLSTQDPKKMVIFFCLVNVVTAIQTWLISIGLANYVLPYTELAPYTYEISHAFGLAIPVFTSYVGHKYWSFKNS